MSDRDDLKSRNIEFLLEEQEEPMGLKWKKLISRVLQRIPNDVVARFYDIAPRFFVMEKGRVASTKFVGDFTNTSTDVEVTTSKPWIIIIDEAGMEKLSLEAQMKTIAEELAHVYLGHEALNEKLAACTGKSKLDFKSEDDAARLIKHWGF
jgi:hypothetical protein